MSYIFEYFWIVATGIGDTEKRNYMQYVYLNIYNIFIQINNFSLYVYLNIFSIYN